MCWQGRLKGMHDSEMQLQLEKYINIQFKLLYKCYTTLITVKKYLFILFTGYFSATSVPFNSRLPFVAR